MFYVRVRVCGAEAKDLLLSDVSSVILGRKAKEFCTELGAPRDQEKTQRVPTFSGVWYGTLAAQRVGGYGPDRPSPASGRLGLS